MRINWHILVWILLLPLPSQSEPSPPPYREVIISTDEWPDLTNKDGTGFIFDLLRAIYEPAGIILSHEFMPWKRTIHEVAAGKADIAIGVYKSDKASKTEVALLKSIYPIIEERIEAVSLHEAAKNWQGQQSLADSKVAIVRGFDHHKLLEIKVKPYYVNDYDQALRMLLAERVKFVLGEQLLTYTILPKYLKEGHELSRNIVFSLPNYMAFTPSEGGRQLLKLYEQRIGQMQKSGELHAIYRKWGLEMPPMPHP
jgi:polar amino acid transport system substrate-binding protein